MKKTLVAYFSCTGTTEQVSKKVAQVVNGDLFEIIPERPYTKEDLDWQNKNSRSTLEMQDETSRPLIKSRVDNMNEYKTIYLGFPIWWYKAPTIINTFLESYDFTDKKIILFCTSGGSSLTDSYMKLKNKYNYNFIESSRLDTYMSLEDIKECIGTMENY